MATPVKPMPHPAVPAAKPVAASPKPVAAPRPVTQVRQTAAPTPAEPEVVEQVPEARPGTAIISATAPGALAAPGQWDDVLAEYAGEAAAAQPIPGGQFISLKAGLISIDGNEYEALEIIALDSCFERAYYSQGFDPDNPASPDCFAISRTGPNGMTPSEVVAQPYGETCDACPLNKWGSDVDPKTGEARKGKACKERRRIAFISTNGLTPEVLENPDVRFVKTPVTSSKQWDAYVHFLKATYNRPPFAVVTNFSTRPDRDTQFKLVFQPVGSVDDELIPHVIEAHKRFKAADTILFPYGVNTAEESGEEQPAEGQAQAAPAPAAPPPALRPAAPPVPRAAPVPAPKPRKF